MRWIRPQLDAPQETIAEEQQEYCTLTGAFLTHPEYGVAKGASYNTVVVAVRPRCRCRRRRRYASVPHRFGVLTFGSPLQPLLVLTGREEASAAYGVGIHI